MKRILMAIVFLFFCVSAVGAAEVTFTWDANTESDLAGYYLYQSNTPGNYTFGSGNEILTIPAGTETCVVAVSDGGWYWVLTAIDTSGNESGPSNECSKYIDEAAPSPPGGLKCFLGTIK